MASAPVLQTMKAQDHPVIVPELSRYASALSVHEGLVSRQRGGSTSVSLCDLVSLRVDESDPPRGTENPRVGGSIPSLVVGGRPTRASVRRRAGRGHQRRFRSLHPDYEGEGQEWQARQSWH